MSKLDFFKFFCGQNYPKRKSRCLDKSKHTFKGNESDVLAQSKAEGLQNALLCLHTALTDNCERLDGIKQTLVKIQDGLDRGGSNNLNNIELEKSKKKTSVVKKPGPVASVLVRKEKVAKTLSRCHKELDGLARTHFDLQLKLEKTESQEKLIVDNLTELEYRVDNYT